jgi:membrane protease YdiL (CAAX protease family)
MSDPSSTAGASPQLLPPPESPVPLKPVSRFRWGIHLALMAALPVFVGVAGAAAGRNRGPALTNSVHGLLIMCVLEILLFAVPFGLAWLASRPTKNDLLLRWRPGYWVLPLGAGYSVVMQIVARIVLIIVLAGVFLTHHASVAEVRKFAMENRPQVEKLVDMQAMAQNPAYYWLTVVLVSFVIGGLREEMWRSAFLAGLRSIWPRVFDSRGVGIGGAAIASLFFGAAHLPQGLLAVALITVVGFMLGVIMTLHRSIWPSVMAHGFFDAASLALLPWAAHYLQEMQRMHPAGG